ncbi:MAG: hypothetical protein NTV86_16995 [Planctomycetota bacterium]|nr:hypothetical protein [Planctomycetota bacterium]
MRDTDDYRPGGLAGWFSRTNPVSAAWISLLCLAAIGWVSLRYARGTGTGWTLLTQICVLLTFAVSPWCRYAIARGSRWRRVLILLPILLLLLAVEFLRHDMKTPAPRGPQTSSRPAAPSSGPAAAGAK